MTSVYLLPLFNFISFTTMYQFHFNLIKHTDMQFYLECVGSHMIFLILIDLLCYLALVQLCGDFPLSNLVMCCILINIHTSALFIFSF
jgi:hypothetical protein